MDPPFNEFVQGALEAQGRTPEAWRAEQNRRRQRWARWRQYWRRELTWKNFKGTIEFVILVGSAIALAYVLSPALRKFIEEAFFATTELLLPH